MRNPCLTVTIYPGCVLTEDEIIAAHMAAVEALPERAALAVSSARLVDLGDDEQGPEEGR
jgi:hypothetical protein